MESVSETFLSRVKSSKDKKTGEIPLIFKERNLHPLLMSHRLKINLIPSIIARRDLTAQEDSQKLEYLREEINSSLRSNDYKCPI